MFTGILGVLFFIHDLITIGNSELLIRSGPVAAICSDARSAE